MPKRRKDDYLSDKISSMINAAPEVDDEDEDLTTVNQIKQTGADSSAEGHSDSGDELNLSQFRKINIELLDADDDKYSGVRVSRQQLSKDQQKAFGSEDSDDSDCDVDTGSAQASDQEDYLEREDIDQETESSEGDGSSSDGDSEQDVDEEMPSEDEEEDDDDDDDENEDEDDDDEQREDEDVGEDDTFRHVSGKASADIEKGHAIRNQFSLWDSLLECRIKFQKCVAVANRLPQHGKINLFTEAGGEPFQLAQKAAQTSVKKVLNSLLDLQQVCLDVNTNKFEESVGKRSREDEEITSSSDDGEEKEEKPSQSKHSFHRLNKRRKLEDISGTIQDLHERLVPFRNETIQKWNDKTRVSQMSTSSKDFSAFEQSTLKQIEMVLADKQRLIKRTRTKRSVYHILGERDEGPDAKVQKLDENSEIFDDDDFYHQLLRELLERKTSDVTDPVQLSRQWIELQKARSKMKRPVDQKASKGRKLRYNVHQKLINFMMPVDNTSWSDEAKNELFASLFGNQKV